MYTVGPYLEPRVITTLGGRLVRLRKWRPTRRQRCGRGTPTSEGSKMFDILNPFTASKRYREQGVEDLGAKPHLVIPTPTTKNGCQYPHQQLGHHGLSTFGQGRKINIDDVWSMNMVLKAQDSHYVQLIEEAVELTARGRTLPTEEILCPCPSLRAEGEPHQQHLISPSRPSHPAGPLHAIQTLLSLTDKEGNIPETVITDGPRYRYRGVLLDVARNFQSKEKIFRYLDVMAMYKLNKLHFHLTDDEGWRLTIPGLEELTEVGATRCHDPTETKCLLPFLGSGPFSGPPGTGHYSVDDYRDIFRYHSTRHIEVIPEIDMPGHSHAAIKSML
ncbi:hypothetical protein Btru_072579 [Bulinus truncatus]|nr:hypothetical protein Btru_072579 [Bulinus truncatus]